MDLDIVGSYCSVCLQHVVLSQSIESEEMLSHYLFHTQVL
jgi:hypothetical protein